MAEEQGSDPRRYRLELAATLLLSIATLGSAFSAWRSSAWSGVQSAELARANDLQSESIRFATRAALQTDVDVGMFLAWLESAIERDQLFADFLAAHFRPEFRGAYDAWMAEPPLDFGPDLPKLPAGTPFGLPAYRLDANEQASELRAQAEQAVERATRASTVATQFVLTAVLYASVLFIAGISIKVRSARSQGVLVVAAAVLLAATLIYSLLVPRL